MAFQVSPGVAVAEIDFAEQGVELGEFFTGLHVAVLHMLVDFHADAVEEALCKGAFT